MSETESHTGKLIEVKLTGAASLQEFCKMICNNELGFPELPAYYGSWEECFNENCCEKYFLHDGKIYKVYDKDHTEDDLFESTIDAGGNINYAVSYYNGGCSFNEALEQAIKNRV